MHGLFAGVLIVGMLAYGAISLWAAYLGLGYQLGNGWAIGIIAVSCIFRLSLFVSVGAFLGALYVWHWHWAIALLFAAPGLALMIPGAIASIIAETSSKRRN